MPGSTLDGASKYLNNLLLARGFLKDGKTLDFELLATSASDTNSDDEQRRYSTTTSVINLVHDLVLRLDRDAEQREILTSTIRNLRQDEAKNLHDLQRVQDKNIQLQNDITTHTAQHRSLSQSLKRAQAEQKDLKEQNLRMKSTLDQVRAKCISDVRKRDIELEKLRNHLNNLSRGKNMSGGIKIHTLDLKRPERKSASNARSLEEESNDFLAAIVNETSTENVALRNIVQDSLDFLRQVTGWEQDEKAPIGIPGQYRDKSLTPVPVMGKSMTQVLAHTQTLLRDPSFVPIEEVHIRDEEIEKLRAGWEKMANRWKEAVTMMSQWRQKTVEQQEQDLEVDGLSGISAFGRSIAMRPNGMPVLDTIEEEELTSMLLEGSRLADRSMLSIKSNLDESIEDAGTPRQAFQIHEDEGITRSQPLLSSPARRGVSLKQPLTDSDGNTRKRKSETTLSPRKRRSFTPEEQDQIRDTRSTSDDLVMDSEGSDENPFEEECGDDEARITVAEKLAAVEAEASEATEVIRRRQALTRSDERRKSMHKTNDSKTKRSTTKDVGRPGSRPAKSEKVKNRRRSTLTPAELGNLMRK